MAAATGAGRRGIDVPVPTTLGELMSKNKGGREIRKPKQSKKPEPTPATPMGARIDGAVKKPK